MKRLAAIVLFCALHNASPARADEPPPVPATDTPEVVTPTPATDPKLHEQRLQLTLAPPPIVWRSETSRRTGLAMLIAGGGLATLGAIFIGLAKYENDQAVSSGTYDPAAEDRRNAFAVTQTVFLTVAATAAVFGTVLLCDR